MKASSTTDSIIDSVATSTSVIANQSSLIHKGQALTLVKPEYAIINNTFVLGENDGQLASATSTPSPSGRGQGEGSNFLINQMGSGDLLQLAQNGETRLLVQNDGSVNILANATSTAACSPDGAHLDGHHLGTDCPNILSVSNASTTLFTINAVGDINTIGHLAVGKDTAGSAIIKAGDNQTTVTFAVPYLSIPKIAISVNGLPNFYYGVATKTPESFVIQISTTSTQDVSFDWIALAQPQDTPSVSSRDLSVLSSPISPIGQISPISPIVSNPPDASSTPPSDSGQAQAPSDGASGQVAGTSTPDTVTPPADTSATPPADVTPPPIVTTPPADTAPTPPADTSAPSAPTAPVTDAAQ